MSKKMKFRLFRRRGVMIHFLVLIGILISGCSRSPEVRSAKYIEAGKGLLKKNDPSRATLEFLNAAKATPRNPEVYYQLSLAYQAAGDSRNAVVTLRKALELNPQHAAAQLRLAQFMASGDDRSVLQDAQQH